MGYWVEREGVEYAWDDPPPIEVTVTDNPIVHELLDSNGNVIRQWRERNPIGFR